MRVTISLCISGICCRTWKHKLSSLTTLTSKLCNKLSTQFKHLWLMESQTISNPAFLTDRERGWLNSSSLVPFSKFTKVSLRIKHFSEMITRVLDYTRASNNGHLSTTAIFFRRIVYTFTVVSASTATISTMAIFFCPQGSCCRELQLYKILTV